VRRLLGYGPLLLALHACEPVPPVGPPAQTAAAVVTPMEPIPDGDLGASIRRGLAILTATRDSLPGHVGNDLRCTSCHLDEGRRPDAMPWVGVAARFPQYRSRAASVQRLEDRINDCFERSLAGTALAWNDPAMRDMVAYMAHLSTGVPHGGSVSGQGVRLASAVRGDTAVGATLFAATCARCHGADGEGSAEAPPLWGPRSYTIGAGMARLRTVAGFVRHNMPFDKPGTLTDQQAQDIGTFITTRPRPDFARKADDWPRGDPPVDVAYPTTAGRVTRP